MHCCLHSLNCGIQIENTEKIHLSFTKKPHSFKQEIYFQELWEICLKINQWQSFHNGIHKVKSNQRQKEIEMIKN